MCRSPQLNFSSTLLAIDKTLFKLMALEKSQPLRYDCNSETLFRNVHFRKAAVGKLSNSLL